MQIEAIQSSSFARGVGSVNRPEQLVDSISSTVATFAVLNQMKRAMGAAIDSEQVELLDIIVRYGNNPDGIPALHYAIKMKDERAVELLLNHGADPNSLSRQVIVENYQYPVPLLALDYAAYSGNVKILQLLIDSGADVNYSKIAEVDVMGEKTYWYRAYSPLFFAAMADSEEAARILLVNGANPEGPTQASPSPIVTINPLNIAVMNKSSHVFRLLLERTPDICSLVSGPQYFLHDAASLGCAEIVQLLLERGAYVDLRRNEQTPLMCSSAACLEVLLNAGADPKAKDRAGHDALYNASFRGDIESARILLKHGVNITPEHFHVACSGWKYHKNGKAYLRFLLDNGADINACVNGKTALEVAKADNQQDLVSWLICHGARD